MKKRSLEFRLWHINLREMMIIDQLEWFGNRPGELSCVAADHLHEAWAFLPNEVEVMQFTGEYDKNGVKIFEGDIVLVDHECISGIKPNKAVVEWWQLSEITCPGWNLWHFGPPLETKDGGHVSGTGLGPMDLAQYTVLGNKWQHPELLDGFKV